MTALRSYGKASFTDHLKRLFVAVHDSLTVLEGENHSYLLRDANHRGGDAADISGAWLLRLYLISLISNA